MPKLSQEELNALNGQISSLKEQMAECKAKLEAKDKEVRMRGEQMSELSSELNELKSKNEMDVKNLHEAREKIKELEGQISSLQEQKAILEKSAEENSANFNNLNKSFERIAGIVEDFADTRKKIESKDEKLNELRNKIKELNEKLQTSSDEKDKILKEKVSEMEAAMQEKMELNEKIADLEMELKELKHKTKKLKEKVRSSGDDLFSKAMQMDQMKKQIDEKEKELSKVSEKIEGIITGKTGIFSEIEHLTDYLDARFDEAKRSIRICVPDLNFLKEHGFLDRLYEFADNNFVVNLAFPVNEDVDMDDVEKLKDKGATLTETPEKSIFTMAVDGGQVALGVLTQTRVKGVYTTIPELVTLLKAALMFPFVKGSKL